MTDEQAEQIRRFLQQRQEQADRLRDGHVDAAVLASVVTGKEGWRIALDDTHRN